MFITIFKRLKRIAIEANLNTEPLFYRLQLYNELLFKVKGEKIGRILEIGPKDGLDSKRLAALHPRELIMIDLPEKRKQVKMWLKKLGCSYKYLENNFMYMNISNLGKFDIVYCTGVLYHNAEQLRLLRKMYKLLKRGGYLVLESAVCRSPKISQKECFVEIYYPQTYRNTGTVTHLPTIGAIKTWLQMVGFKEIYDSKCYQKQNQDLIGTRYACICKKADIDDAGGYYTKSGLNPKYKFGDSF